MPASPLAAVRPAAIVLVCIQRFSWLPGHTGVDVWNVDLQGDLLEADARAGAAAAAVFAVTGNSGDLGQFAHAAGFR